MHVALVYDRLNKIGGAEHILTGLHEMFPQADWFTSVWDPTRAQFSAYWRVHPSFINKIPYLRTRHELIPFLMPFIFESFDLTGYDLVISVGSAESKGVVTRPETLHINYCLTPTRYLYSHRDHYLRWWAARWVGEILRKWDLVAATRPDVMISISEQVKNRVQKYYKRVTDVIYPPVDTRKFRGNFAKSDYYLIVSRLVPYKNISLAVDAFNQNGKKLVIAGTGSELQKLQRKAAGNIEFRGLVPDRELPALYGSAKAFIQCNEEDFGIAMVESLAAGRPVIAFAAGGSREIVTEATGVLYNELSVVSLIRTIERFESMTFSAAECRKRAEKFDHEVWVKSMRERIQTEWQQHQDTNRI